MADGTNSQANLIVRPGRPEDHPTIARFQIEMAWESEKMRLDPETCGKGVRGVFEKPARGRYYVCESAGTLVGCLLCVDEWSDWRNGTVWWIHSVYVVPEARRKGVFNALYSKLRSLAEADPAIRGLRLYVEKTNTRAQEVYRRIGMTDQHYDLFEFMKGSGGG